jgi:hypothetical protein
VVSVPLPWPLGDAAHVLECLDAVLLREVDCLRRCCRPRGRNERKSASARERA